MTVTGGSGSVGLTSAALALVAASSAAGSWCAAVGMPALGAVAAAELGLDLARFALVPAAGPQWATVTAALLDALDIVMVQPPFRVQSADARRLSARARERGSVLLVMEPGCRARWPTAGTSPDVVSVSGWAARAAARTGGQRQQRGGRKVIGLFVSRPEPAHTNRPESWQTTTVRYL